MGRLRLVIIAFLVCGILSLSLIGITHAFPSSEVSSSPTKTINKTIYDRGQTVNITGNINGDVYCAGQSVTINANISGDVICVAQNLTINGKILGSVRAGAETFTMNAKVGHSLSVAAETFTLGSSADIGQDATILGSNIDLVGSIGRDAVVRSTNLVVNNSIGRNLQFTGTALSLKNAANINGQLNYTSDQVASIASGATIKGETNYSNPPSPSHNLGTIISSEASSFIYTVVALLALGLVLISLFPQQIHKVNDEAVSRLGRTMLTGLLTIVVIPLAIVLLTISFIGIPLALLIFLLWCILVIISFPMAAYYLGSMVHSRSHNALALMSIGCIILSVLLSIPLVGALVVLVSYMIGTGSLIQATLHNSPKPDFKVK